MLVFVEVREASQHAQWSELAIALERAKCFALGCSCSGSGAQPLWGPKDIILPTECTSALDPPGLLLQSEPSVWLSPETRPHSG